MLVKSSGTGASRLRAHARWRLGYVRETWAGPCPPPTHTHSLTHPLAVYAAMVPLAW